MTTHLKLVGPFDSFPGLTIQRLADAKGFPPDYLPSLGLTDLTYMSRPAVRIPYLDEAGELVATRFRLALTDDEGINRFTWKKGNKPCLYGLWRLSEARKQGRAVIVEGESDCFTLWHLGIPAIGVPGASNWKSERDEPKLDGIERVYVVIEPDTGGEALLKRLTSGRLAERLSIVRPDGYKDVSEWFLADPERFAASFNAACSAAVPWHEVRDAERIETATELYKLAEPLLHDPNLMERVKSAIRAGGYAGDVSAPAIVFLAITSRFLERPMNLALVSPSASGKSRAVQAGVELHPPEAVYKIDAGSPRALIYSEESFEHRVLWVGEADSIPADGPAASALRSIADDNRLVYEVVERDE